MIGTLGLMLVNTSVPVNVYANNEVEKEVHIYKLGEQDESIVELKDYLDLLGYTIEEAPNEESIFTDEFTQLIKQYQKDNDLVVTGKLDEKLLTLIEVQVIVGYLDILGYKIENAINENSNDEKDIFTKELSELIKQYQEDNALEVTGELDEDIFEFIEEQALAIKEKIEETTNSGEINVDNTTVDKDNEHSEDIEQDEKTEEAEIKEEEKEDVAIDDATISQQKTVIYKAQAVAEPTVFKNGMRHEKVKVLKADLKKLGFTVPGNGTTLYGKQTESKVKEFQRYYGLVADGQAGPSTFNKNDCTLR